MKREYEIGLVINPETADEEAEKIKTSITDILKKGKGTIENIDDWGRKALAYPIEKHNEGIYVFIKTLSPGDVIAAVERRLKLNENVMRFIVIRLDDKLKKTNKLEKKWKRIERFSKKPAIDSERERPSGRPAAATPAPAASVSKQPVTTTTPKETAVPKKVEEEKVETTVVKEAEVKEEKVEVKVEKEAEVKVEKVEAKVEKEAEVKVEKTETKVEKEPKEKKTVKKEKPAEKKDEKVEKPEEKKPVKPKKAPAKKTTKKTEEKTDEEVENAETE